MTANPRGVGYQAAGMYGRETRTKGHICGNCRWQGQGRDDCPNNRPSQTVPYMEPDIERGDEEVGQ